MIEENWIAIDLKKAHKLWPDIKGVYKISLGNKINYIGESKCLKTRLFTHLSYAVFYDVFDTIKVEIMCVDLDDGDRKSIEKRLIDKFQPRANGKKDHLISKLQQRDYILVLTSREEKILEFLKRTDRWMTRAELQTEFSLGYSAIQRGVAKMEKRGLIKTELTSKNVKIHKAIDE